jgi:hypothetical protein
MLRLHIRVNTEVVGEVLSKITHRSSWIQQHRLLLLLKGRRVAHQLAFHSFQVLRSLQGLVVLQTDLNSRSVLVIRVVGILVCLHLQSELLCLLLFLSCSFYFHCDLLLPRYKVNTSSFTEKLFIKQCAVAEETIFIWNHLFRLWLSVAGVGWTKAWFKDVAPWSYAHEQVQ